MEESEPRLVSVNKEIRKSKNVCCRFTLPDLIFLKRYSMWTGEITSDVNLSFLQH